MTKQIEIDNAVVDLYPVAGDIYVASPGNLMVELVVGTDYDVSGGKVVSTEVDRVKYAVPLPEWETWAIDKWGYEVVQEAKRLLWMHT